MQGVTIRHSSQQFRSLLASIEILAAAAVSNALVLGSFVRDRGTKKQRFRFGSTGGQSSLDRSNGAPRRAITAKNWGSDADLVGDLGMRLDPELTKDPANGPRPAPMASATAVNPDKISHKAVDQNWTFPDSKSAETDGIDLKSPRIPPGLPQYSAEEMPSTPRGMSFFDVGGLLGNDQSSRIHSRQQSIAIPMSSSPVSPMSSPALHPNSASITVSGTEVRRGSHTLLQDIGGLLSPSPSSPLYPTSSRTPASRPAPDSQHSGLIEALQSTPPNTSPQLSKPPPRRRGESFGLQDVGGLLS